MLLTAPLGVMPNAASVTRPTNEQIRFLPFEPTGKGRIALRPRIGSALAGFGIDKTSADRLVDEMVAGQFEHVLVSVPGNDFEIQNIAGLVDVPPEARRLAALNLNGFQRGR